MKILDVSVNWYDGWANSPQLKVLVAEPPDHNEFRFEQRGSLYFAECEGLVRFYAYTKPGQGFGGRTFHITMLDGTEKVLHGPWSSRAGCMNAAGFKPCLDVSYTNSPEVWARGHTFFAGAMTVEAVLPHLPDGVVLAEIHDGYDIRYDPAKHLRGGELWLKSPIGNMRQFFNTSQPPRPHRSGFNG